MLKSFIIVTFISCLAAPGEAQTNVLTQHNDIGRTGQNLTETVLTPANVSSGGFGKLYTVSLDGPAFAQPLYVSSVQIGGVAHSVVFVATEHDSVYAFDANAGGAQLWKASLLDAAHGAAAGATPDPISDTTCDDAQGPEFGVTGTPTIDLATGTLYVVSVTYEGTYPVQRLHALDITSGAEKFGGPITIQATAAGTGVSSSGGTISFDPKWENQRAGLLFVNNTVYITWAAHCDLSPWHGWIMGYSASTGTLRQTAAFLTSPNGIDGGIWMSGGGLSADNINSIPRMFAVTGNGTFDAQGDWGNSVLNLSLTGGISVKDSFTPYYQNTLTQLDLDLGSGSVLVLPDQPGANPHLGLIVSKQGVIYLMNRDNLGGYNTLSDHNLQEQYVPGATQSLGSPAYFNGNVYLWPSQQSLLQYSLTNGLLSSTPISAGGQSEAGDTEFKGTTPSISANGATNGIVWVDDGASYAPLQYLYAYDATDVSKLLWSSSTNAARDSAGEEQKFAVPTIADGKVFLVAYQQLLAYGLLSTGQKPVITNVLASSITSTSATITWTTDQSTTSSVNYGTTSSYGTSSGVQSQLVTSHAVTLTGLTPGTTYNYDVVSANSLGLSSTSSNATFTTVTSGATPPQVGYVAFWGINNSGVTISWSTDVLANTELAYGTTSALGQLTPVQTALTASHGVVLSGLQSGTTYYFVAESTGANGAIGYSTTYSFTTTGVAGTPAPVISAVTAQSITTTSAIITWTTDQASSSLVNYGTSTSYGSASTPSGTLVTGHSVMLTGLTPGTTYDYDVVSANSAGTSASSANYTFATTAATGTPPTITSVTATNVTSTSATITWITNQAASDQVHYGTTTSYGLSSVLSSTLVTAHSVTLTGLTPGTAYDYDVVSANSLGLSATSSNAMFTTTASGGTAPQVGYVAFWGINNSGVTISWSTDVLANTELAYGTTPVLGQFTPVQAALTASHGVVLSGLQSGTTYYFVAESTGTNGTTGYSATYSFTTTGVAGTPAPVISAVTAQSITTTSAIITWTTDQASSSLVNYGTSTSYGSASRAKHCARNQSLSNADGPDSGNHLRL